ncbi:MAG: hypothetical protein JNK78_00355 [Planctomycetes bacterium]|nr:hypothetical protein [Planctomycetota bacterium]
MTGASGDAFARELRCVWSTADGRLHADVTLTGDRPSAWLPLYKDEQVKFRVEAPMQWHRADGAIRWSKLKVDFTATYRMIGTSRSRDFQEWIGRELGEAVRKQVDEAVTNANRKS